MSIVNITADAARAAVAQYRTGGPVLSDDAARMVASWYQTPASADVPITALSHGLEFNPCDLHSRVMTLAATADDETMPDLLALQAWALIRVPHLVISTWKISAADWDQRCAQWEDVAAAGGSPSDVTPPPPADSTIVVAVAECQENDGSWSYPGDPDFPSDTTGMYVDPHDGSVYLNLPVADAALMMLTGQQTGFWAQSWGGDPWSPGDGWAWSDERERKQPFASRYAAPEGDVEIVTAEFVGLAPEQVAEVGRQWAKH